MYKARELINEVNELVVSVVDDESKMTNEETYAAGEFDIVKLKVGDSIVDKEGNPLKDGVALNHGFAEKDGNRIEVTKNHLGKKRDMSFNKAEIIALYKLVK